MTNPEIINNPLMQSSTYKNRAIPFPEIRPEHYLPAVKAAIAKAKANVEKIKFNPDEPNFENTIVALEHCSEDVDMAASVFYSVMSAHTNDEMQSIAQELGPLVSSLSSDIILDEELFKQVKKVWEIKDSLQLTQEEFMLLENTYKDFTRNGALLNPEGKKRLRDIDQRLSTLGPKFSENVLKATNAFELYITDEDKLAGLPESAKEAATNAAEDKGRSGQWLFTLHAPSLIPILKYLDNRELREKIWRAYNSRAFGGEYDNQPVILETLKLRHERAKLLGFKTHADFVLNNRMAESPEKVRAFLEELLQSSKPAAEKDLADVQKFADGLNGPNPLQPWDFMYYSEKLKTELYRFSEEDLRAYFPLEKVVDGVFKHANWLYGLEFEPTDAYPVYHEDVQVYEVRDQGSGNFIGLLYTDFFPRDSKRGGAWMTTFYDQGFFRDELMRPHVSIVCNFTKPTKSKPSLLTFDEVRTLFHEFGHSLHALLSHCHFRSLSGTNVYWDFVELPSQILENWTLEKESLDLFAKHFSTGETIPEDLTKKIKKSSLFQAGYSSLRQVNFALLDMAYHNTDPKDIKSIDEFEREVTKRASVFEKTAGMNFSCTFGHIFSGGYSAGYYSYKWAEVLDADAFELFKEKGLFNKEIAKSFQDNILSKGGTEHPMELYKKFRGREPDPNALLRRDGLI